MTNNHLKDVWIDGWKVLLNNRSSTIERSHQCQTTDRNRARVYIQLNCTRNLHKSKRQPSELCDLSQQSVELPVIRVSHRISSQLAAIFGSTGFAHNLYQCLILMSDTNFIINVSKESGYPSFE